LILYKKNKKYCVFFSKIFFIMIFMSIFIEKLTEYSIERRCG